MQAHTYSSSFTNHFHLATRCKKIFKQNPPCDIYKYISSWLRIDRCIGLHALLIYKLQTSLSIISFITFPSVQNWIDRLTSSYTILRLISSAGLKCLKTDFSVNFSSWFIWFCYNLHRRRRLNFDRVKQSNKLIVTFN